MILRSNRSNYNSEIINLPRWITKKCLICKGNAKKKLKILLKYKIAIYLTFLKKISLSLQLYRVNLLLEWAHLVMKIVKFKNSVSQNLLCLNLSITLGLKDHHHQSLHHIKDLMLRRKAVSWLKKKSWFKDKTVEKLVYFQRGKANLKNQAKISKL